MSPEDHMPGYSDTMTGIEDSIALARLLGGDEVAFGRFILVFEVAVFAFLSRMGFDAATTADLAQDSFLRMWRFRTGYDPERGSVAAWVFRITRNVALTEWQRGGRRPSSHVDPDALDHLAAAGDAEDAASQMQLRDHLHAALQQLDITDRTTIALAYIDGLNSREAAELVGCRPDAFRARLTRARRRLAVLLENTHEAW